MELFAGAITTLTFSLTAYSNINAGDDIDIVINLANSDIGFSYFAAADLRRMDIHDSGGFHVRYTLGSGMHGVELTTKVREAIFSQRAQGSEIIRLKVLNGEEPVVTAEPLSSGDQESDQNSVIEELREKLDYQRSIIQAFVAGDHCALERSQTQRKGERDYFRS